MASSSVPRQLRPTLEARRELRERRRAEARRLRVAGMSVGQIAARLEIDKSTVSRLLSTDPLGPVTPAAGDIEPGNTRALKHGTDSDRTLAPLRSKHQEALSQDYPQLDDRRRAILSDLLARIEQASSWLDGQGSVVREPVRGEPFAIVEHLDRWSTRAWRMLGELGEEPAPRTPAAALVAHVTERYSGRAGSGSARAEPADPDESTSAPGEDSGPASGVDSPASAVGIPNAAEGTAVGPSTSSQPAATRDRRTLGRPPSPRLRSGDGAGHEL